MHVGLRGKNVFGQQTKFQDLGRERSLMSMELSLIFNKKFKCRQYIAKSCILWLPYILAL